MFFQEHEKLIYSPQGSDQKFDPLAIDQLLTIVSDGRINDLLKQWRSGLDGLGDISEDSQRANKVLRAQAEKQLASVARKTFSLPDFPDCCDAVALEWLCDYLEWMAGKGVRGKPPQPSFVSSPAA